MYERLVGSKKVGGHHFVLDQVLDVLDVALVVTGHTHAQLQLDCLLASLACCRVAQFIR
jgi:hypothetical protein